MRPILQSLFYSPPQPTKETVASYSQPLLLLSFILLLLMLGGSIAEWIWETPPYWWMNFLSPTILGLACLWTAGRLILWRRSSLWTPMPWMLISVAVFYGLGPLYYLFADADSLELLDRIWSIDEKDLWLTNFMVIVGTFCIVGTYVLLGFFINMPKHTPPSAMSSVQQDREVIIAERLFYIFAVIGFPLRYLLAVPYSMGMFKFALPGVLFNLSQIIYVCLILLAFLSIRVGGRWRIGFWGLFFVELGIGFLNFNKTGLLYVPLHAAMGFFLARNRVQSLATWFFVVILLYLVTRPLITKSRELLYQSGLRQGASFGQRFQVAQSASQDQEISLAEKSDLGWWSRLNYATYQAYVVSLYEAGEVGTTLQNIPYIFIPRFIWPNKPDMTAVGFDFNERIFGNRSSSTGIGVFGESYWNGGYAMMVLICCYIGLVVLILSWLAVRFVEKKQWIYFPLILSGIRTGLAIDQWIVPVFFGMLVLYGAYFLLLFVISKMAMSDLQTPQRRSVRWRGLGTVRP